MTIERILYDISEIALKNNLVNASYAGPSIYNVNGGTVVDYPYVFTSPTDDITVGDNTTTYGLTLYFVDRLLEDSSNEVDIFSVGVETIKNLIRQLRELDEIVSITETPVIRLFTDTQKMADNCAGAYVRFEITALNTAACAVYFDETGAPIGTYIPAVIKDESVLDNLASKPWVVQYVAEHGGSSGGTDEREVKRLINQALTAYTKTNKFATINGSGITNSESYNLLEREVFREFLSGYSRDKQNIYAAISAATPEDYYALSGTVSENVGKIEQVSADTRALSAATETLSADTSDLRAFLGDLSASTFSSVSSITEGLETLSGATVTLSGATTGIASDLADLSAVTSGLTVLVDGKQDALTAGENITIENNVISAAGNVRSASVFAIWSGTQAAYSALGTYDNNTLYVITDANT